MPPRRSQEQVKKINSVTKEDLRKHGAETELNHRRSPTTVANESLPDTSSRLRTNNATVNLYSKSLPTVNLSENNKSDKSYPGAQHKRIVVQTQPTRQ
jgi:hypothetical protein